LTRDRQYAAILHAPAIIAPLGDPLQAVTPRGATGRAIVRRLVYLAFYGQSGGAEMCLLSLLDGLDRARFAPLVVLSEPGPLADDLRQREVPLLVEDRMQYLVRGARSLGAVGANLRAFLAVERALHRLLAARRIDLVHAFVTPALKYGGVVARLAGIPAVATMHDMLVPPFTRLKRRLIATNVNLFYDRLIVPSLAGRTAALGAGVEPSKLIVIPNGVDTGRFARDETARARVRAELGVAPDTPLVGMVGRFVPLKGHDVLLRALDVMRRRRDRARCVIVGDALFEGEHECKRRVVELAGTLGLQSHVVFTGWRKDVPELLSALDVFVQPATEGDTLPTTVLEAMATGLPVVAARGSSVFEMVEDGRTGCIVPAADPAGLAESLLRLLDDPGLRERMGRAGRAKVEREFGRDRFCRATEAVYTDLLGPA
jgi:glycosyltransferase involved in cell wall biosynthesis